MNTNQVNWDAGDEHQHTNPFVMVHRLLRGKYLWAIGLAFVFGMTGAVFGYMSREPQYESTGIIRIQPSLPKVLYESEQSTAPQMFSSFVNSQAQLISNGGVIENAMSSDAWRQIKDRPEISSVIQVQKRLDIEPNRQAQEIISVSYTDEDPRVSQTIVSSILDAYIAKYSREGSIRNPEIVQALEDRERELMRQRETLNNQISEIASKYRTENLAPLIQNALITIRELEAQETELLGYQAQYEHFRTVEEGTESEMSTPEEAARHDPMVAQWLTEKRDYEGIRSQMMASEGLREEHRDVRRVTKMIEDLDQRIATRMVDLRSGDSAAVLVNEDGTPIPDEARLQIELENVQARLASARDRSAELFAASLRLENLHEDRLSIQKSLSEVNNRLDMIETESLVEDMKEVSGKISIAARPVAPSEPTSDPRLKMAAAGFVGMGSLPVLALLGLGYFSHRVQYSDDDILSGASSGIVGMLPDLGNSLVDQELATASAFAVHQIRSQLQIKNASDEPRVYGVTSPAPGDGKTSMVIALGLSFAESGSRTLLIDLDFIGRGLSVHFGYPEAPSLADSLTDSQAIDSLIRDTEFADLQILPAGFGDDERVSRLSPRTVGAMVDHLRSRYDTILIDSGPILGSVEAAFLAPQADGMVMVVGRGQYKPLVKKAIDQVNAVDGSIVATIFNRASVHELRQSSSSMSVHFSRQFSRQQQQAALQNGLRVGPVAGALFRSKPDQSERPPATGTES